VLKWLFVPASLGALCLCAGTRGPSVLPSPQHHEAENKEADEDGLPRIKDQAQLNRFVARGLLVPLPQNESIEVDEHIPVNRRYCRPWTRSFLLDIGRNYKNRFRKKLKITSGVRTLADQNELRRYNANASPSSTHPTGATVDISWKRMHRQQLAWMVAQMLALERAGKVEATLEHYQACLHVLVRKQYSCSPRASFRPPHARSSTANQPG